ncbi:hypothetical protein LCGC14_0520380 [marine sediment metagenome]|uniref:Uncharacterized protein n=1 Tax=marine sediment metagenome TaxID=412755 RepID=A0A0F9RYP9_9ZZZZ
MCKCLTSLTDQGWPFPFEQRLSFNIETMGNLSAPWGVALQHATKTGKRSSRGSKFLLLNYCPICGKDLREKSEEADDESPT